MNYTPLAILLLIFVGSFHLQAQKKFDYPFTPKEDSIDIYFNEVIKDPYQWMENPEDIRLQSWLDEQELVTKSFEKKYGGLDKYADLYFWSRRILDVKEKKVDIVVTSGDSDSDKLNLDEMYKFEYRVNSYERAPDLYYKLFKGGFYKKLVDIKELETEFEAKIDIDFYEVNKKEKLIAVVLQPNGTDWRKVVFYDLDSGNRIEDLLDHLRAGSRVLWRNKGLYYDRYDEPSIGKELLETSKGQRLCFHQLGNAQETDEVLYRMSPNANGKNFNFFRKKSKLFISQPIKRGNAEFTVYSVTEFNADTFRLRNLLTMPNKEGLEFTIAEVDNQYLYFRTNWAAPNQRIVRLDLINPKQPENFIVEYDVLLTEFQKVSDNVFAGNYRNGGKEIILFFDGAGNFIKKMAFLDGEKVSNFWSIEEKSDKVYFSVSSFLYPKMTYSLSLKDFSLEEMTSINTPVDYYRLETRYIEYHSKDGTLIPMYLICKKSLKYTSNNPVLMYGYGGYGVTIDSGFNLNWALWLDKGGVIAIPMVRGGGSKGKAWSEAGRRLNKQNCIDDFISAAEYLIREKITKPEKLAVKGGSHGGMLVGAALTQRPELFKAAIISAGALDMLRFEQFTVGKKDLNIDEFGTVSIKEDYDNLKSYSPLHNIEKDEKYPNVLLITGDKDDRVPPHHSYKFLASLQEKGRNDSKYFMILQKGAGHQGASNSRDWSYRYKMEYTFLYRELKVSLDR
ncbi:MAG: prolyl oligopeptidase family serine peptidase [Saprospiraceae bacterium]|nr:prolyl oligopeptidase family serine peptidase [Saprospiraceae bacterium]